MRKKLKKYNLLPISTVIENFSHDGRGVARVNGKATFISGALTDEQVTFLYTNQKKDYDEGRVVSVNVASNLREVPKCAHYEICGGCSLQHLKAEAQIQEKQKLLIELLNKIGKTNPGELLEPLVGPIWHYRNKARLSTRYVRQKSATLVGFRERDNSRFIADIKECLVLNKKVADEINNLRELLTSFTDPNTIAQVEVAAGDDDVALIFRNMLELTEDDELKLKNFADRTNFKIFLQPGGMDSVFLFYPENASEYLTYVLPDFNLKYSFHPTDFTQVNAFINRKMIARAVELMDLSGEDIVLDLFCGLGNFSLPLANNAKQVIGVEGSNTMVDRARMNAYDNGINNVDFMVLNLEEEDSLSNNLFKKANKLLIDPPRTGAHAIVKQIDKLDIKRIVYVSCNPVTLARDTDVLVNRHGYKLVSSGVMDMFPHTAHVESIALFLKE